LGDGEVSGLANEEIRPLHDDNGNEVTTLSITESLSSVANLAFGDRGFSVEPGVFNAGRVPSAGSPGAGVTVNVEETEVDLAHLETIPVKHLTAGVLVDGLAVSAEDHLVGGPLLGDAVDGVNVSGVAVASDVLVVDGTLPALNTPGSTLNPLSPKARFATLLRLPVMLKVVTSFPLSSCSGLISSFARPETSPSPNRVWSMAT
jgi:hypothetical protein